MNIQDILMKDIFCDNSFNCRGFIPPIDVMDLVKSIEDIGLQQPIIVQPWNKDGFKWRIISGHRRYTAMKVLERDTINAIISEVIDELQARKLNLEENLKRKNLNILQEAQALVPFCRAGWTQQEIAKQFSESVNWAHVRVNLLKLPEDIQQTAAAGILTQEHIKQLAQMKGNKDMMYEAVRKIKLSRESGERKKIVAKPKKIKPFKKRFRDKNELHKMLQHVMEYIEPGLTTRALAWAAGEISDYEFYREIETYCAENEIPYEIPQEIMQAAMA